MSNVVSLAAYRARKVVRLADFRARRDTRPTVRTHRGDAPPKHLAPGGTPVERAKRATKRLDGADGDGPDSA